MIKLLLVAMIGLCPTEDSSNCIWDATIQGNQQGSSFLDVGGHLLSLGLLDH